MGIKTGLKQLIHQETKYGIQPDFAGKKQLDKSTGRGCSKGIIRRVSFRA